MFKVDIVNKSFLILMIIVLVLSAYMLNESEDNIEWLIPLGLSMFGLFLIIPSIFKRK